MTLPALDQLKPKDAMNIVCLFFAQSDQPSAPHAELGYTSQPAHRWYGDVEANILEVTVEKNVIII